MDSIDSQLLNIMQTAFPLDPRPYRAIAEQIGISEEEAFSRTQAMVRSGVIRRIGPAFDTVRLGHAGALVAARVPSDRLDEVAGIVSEYPQVTHNYSRDHEYNLWFTLVCRDEEEIARVADELSSRAQTPMVVLRSERVFKVRVDLRMP